MIAQGPLDAELFATVRESVARMNEMNQQIAALDAYIESAKSFFGFLAFGKKKAATRVLESFGLVLTRENAARVSDFLKRLKARVLVQDELQQLTGASGQIAAG